MPQISLCIIARDEESMLPDCLRSVQGAVDEIIVCDTGSSDRTRQIAVEAGAIVVDHPWRQDFSAARNAALAAATGDYVLILDADERLAPGSGAVLRVAAARPLDMGLLYLHDADALDAPWAQVLDGRRRLQEPVTLPRLFRRTPDLEWEGIVHESPRSWITRERRNTQVLEVHILHLGAVPALREARQKGERNRGLLERKVAAAPQDSSAWAYLASERRRAGDLEGFHEAVEKGWQALLTQRDRGERPEPVNIGTQRAHQLLTRRDDEAVLSLTRLVRSWGVRHPNLSFLEGVALLNLAGQDDAILMREAATCFERCLSWTASITQECLPGARSWGAATWLGNARLLLGEPTTAQQAFNIALKDHPEPEAARCGIVESLLAQGEAEQALRALQPLLQIERPDPWVLGARVCSELRAPQDMAVMVKRAAQLSDKGFFSPHRREQLVQAQLEARLYTGKPAPGPGPLGQVGALISRKPATSPPASPTGLERVVLNLISMGRADDLEPLFEPRAEELLPGLGRRLEETLSSQGIQIDDDGEPDFVFIGGAGRSGTTLFRSMLSAHRNFYCGPELKLVTAICRQEAAWRQGMAADLAEAGVTGEVLDEAVRAFISTLLRRTADGSPRIAEKTPHNLIYMQTQARLFPRARFIHVIRDGRAVASSLTRQRWMDPATGKPVWFCEDFSSGSRYWQQIVRSSRAQSRGLENRYLEIHYEDLVRNPEHTMRLVLAFLGEPWDARVLAHQRSRLKHSALESSTEAVQEAVHGRAVDRWRQDVSEEVLATLDQDAASLLAELGYTRPADEGYESRQRPAG